MAQGACSAGKRSRSATPPTQITQATQVPWRLDMAGGFWKTAQA